MNPYVEAARRLVAQFEAEALAMGDPGYARSIWREVGRQLPKEGKGKPPIPPSAPVETGWRCRVMLFDAAGDVQADTMPDQPPDAAPDTERGTLRLIGDWLRDCATGFHADRQEGAPLGLDAETLDRSIMSLRVSLSRNGGQTWWRIPYSVDGEQWRAAVRVERATQ